jgi:rSAM/selenodomain-associated transferase 1
MTRPPPESVPVAVFAKAPLAGAVKTRLIARLGPEPAAGLHLLLLRRTLETAVSAQTGLVSLWCTPTCDHPALTDCSRDFGVPLHAQRGADLGERMFHALASLCRHGPALLIGCDCPALMPADLQGCAELLRYGSDAAFIPADDGGYVLIGVRNPQPFLFEGLPWGSGEVMTQTRARLAAADWHWREWRTLWDVDRPADYDRLLATGLLGATDAVPAGGAAGSLPGRKESRL